MHSGLEDESKLDVQKADWTSDHCHRHIAGRTLHSKWREVCTGHLDSQSLHFCELLAQFSGRSFLARSSGRRCAIFAVIWPSFRDEVFLAGSRGHLETVFLCPA